MLRRLALCVAIASLTFVAPRPAPAATQITTTYATVDAAEMTYSFNFNPLYSLIVTGIVSGQTTPTTTSHFFGSSSDALIHCHRVAMIAMAKPGRYLFGITGTGNSNTACKLTRIVP